MNPWQGNYDKEVKSTVMTSTVEMGWDCDTNTNTSCDKVLLTWWKHNKKI